MTTVKTYINSTTTDTRKKWGVFLAETSLTALMTPAARKDYITNESALSHGKQVLTANDYLPKTADRDVQLVFGLEAKSLAQFLTRYNSFCEELKKGAITLIVEISEGDTYLKTTYYLNYLSCSQFSEYNGRLGRFALKLNEPNPENRVQEHSSDISL